MSSSIFAVVPMARIIFLYEDWILGLTTQAA
jgi:hypothetical protein